MKKCDKCNHPNSEFCYGCAYADKFGFPQFSTRDPDEENEEEDVIEINSRTVL